MDGQTPDEQRPAESTDIKHTSQYTAEPDPTPDHTEPEPPVDFVQRANEYAVSRKGRPYGKIIFILLVLILAAAAVYWFGFKENKQAANSSASSNKQSSGQAASSASQSTTHYDSPNFNLSFDYPSTWKVKDEGGGELTVTSPPMSMTDSLNQSTTGKIVMTIRSKARPLTEFGDGNAIAIRQSDKITYTKPTSTQRHNTYISFVNYANGTDATGMDGVYVTGDYGYKANQDVLKTDFAKVDPRISITFQECNTAKCAGKTTPLTINASSWDNSDFSDPLLAMLESLAIE